MRRRVIFAGVAAAAVAGGAFFAIQAASGSEPDGGPSDQLNVKQLEDGPARVGEQTVKPTPREMPKKDF
ncbi:hypothetical protein GCM10027589_55900 [Actinocorallia lasiicapitis]